MRYHYNKVALWFIHLLAKQLCVCFIIVSSLQITGCTSSSSTAVPPPQQLGGKDKSVISRGEQLLGEFDGWQIWEMTDASLVTCMAVKPVNNNVWPSIAKRKIWEARIANSWSKDQRIISGGAGFFMYITNRVDVPYFGFYGKYPYRLPSVAEINGTPVLDTNHGPTVLSWEDRDVSFRITTQPSAGAYNEAHDASGTIHFSDVQRAYNLMMECHSSASW
jgi:hypothetical protein